MVKVLMTGVSNIGRAGVATIAYNLGQSMDSINVEVGYLAQRGLSNNKYKKCVKDKGNKIFVMDPIKGGKIKKAYCVINWVYSILKSNDYDIIHINTDTAYLAAIYIWIAKRAKVPYIVVHSHSTMVDDRRKIIRQIKKNLHKLCFSYVMKNTDLRLACSTLAAKWLFGDRKTTIIPNGIDIERFKYDAHLRKKYRKELNVENQYVIASVGRLAYQKNPLYTVDIFMEILKKVPSSKLLFIGDGELRQEVQKYVNRKGIVDRVLFLGNREDIPQLLSASDTFLLPSKFEGLGIAYIEAQASGFPVFASDQVPKEAFVCKNIFRVSLNEEPKKWAEQILAHKGDERLENVEDLKKHGYDIQGAAKILQGEYLKLMDRG